MLEPLDHPNSMRASGASICRQVQKRLGRTSEMDIGLSKHCYIVGILFEVVWLSVAIVYRVANS